MGLALSHKELWLDADGVLLDYTRAFLYFTRLDQKGVDYDNLLDYDLTKLFDSTEECLNTMLRFAMSTEFSKLPAIADPDLLVALKNVGYSLRVITKLPAPAKSRVNRILNLSKCFGPVFDEIVFTGATQCKVDYLRDRKALYRKEMIVVEDNPDFLRKADALYGLLGFEVLGVSHPYNSKETPALKRTQMFDSMNDIAEVLLHREV